MRQNFFTQMKKLNQVTPLFFSGIPIVLLLLYLFSAQVVNADSIQILTGELPPYSYTDGNEHTGIGGDIVNEIFKRTKTPYPIQSLPWSRSVVLSQKEDNRLIYPLGRTKERENNYLWIGPILEDRLVFLVRASDERTFGSLDDFKDLKVGVLLNAPPQKRLQGLNFTKIDTVHSEDVNIKKLLKGRLDAWYAAERIMMHTIDKEGFDKNEFKVGFVDRELIFYIGASKSLATLAAAWQKTLDEMKSDGTYQKIVDRK